MTKAQKFYVYHDGTHYIQVGDYLKLRRVSNINKAHYWTDIDAATTWRNKIYTQYPHMVLKEAVLTLK